MSPMRGQGSLANDGGEGFATSTPKERKYATQRLSLVSKGWSYLQLGMMCGYAPTPKDICRLLDEMPRVGSRVDITPAGAKYGMKPNTNA